MPLQLVCIQNFGCVFEGLKVRLVYDLDMSVSMGTLVAMARAFKEDIEVLNETRPELARKMEDLACERWEAFPGTDADEVVTWVLGEVQEQLLLPPVWTVTLQGKPGEPEVRCFSEARAAYAEALECALTGLAADPEQWSNLLKARGVPLVDFHRHLVDGEFREAHQVLEHHMGSLEGQTPLKVRPVVQKTVLRNEACPSEGLNLLMESLLQA